MPKSRRSAVQRYHDRVAPRYDHSYDDEFWQWHDMLTWDYLKPFLPRDQGVEVVDLGCGTGKWAARLIKSGYRVTCVDISHRMLDQARAKVEPHGDSNRASFLQADLSDLSELAAGRFGLAVALGDPIGCTPQPRKTMKQIKRILRDGGTLVASFDNRLSGIEYYVESGDPATLARFLRDGRTHWLTRDKDERFEIVTFTPRDLVRLVETTGFKLLDLVGKTVLPLRRHRKLLATSRQRRTWASIEKKLARDEHALSLASHLQVACRPQPR